MIWVRGRIVPDDALKISVLDRTFEHGLGLFETLRTWNGHPTLLPRHVDRLCRSAAELRLPLDPDSVPGREAVQELLVADGRQGDAIVRITLSGGTSESTGSTLWMRSSALPATAATGVILGQVCPARTDALASHKTLNHWVSRIAFETAQRGGFDECLTVSPDGSLWEGSRSNLFVVVQDQILTPPSAGKILPGIMRSVIMERGPRLGLDIREAPLSFLDRLLQPVEVFLSNSVRGIMPVRQWGDARFPAPGPVARLLWDDILRWLKSGGTIE
jgi:branched-subunit amino acid aminotransferase/4-amino-4-deoxychorismate lyase